MKSPRRILPKPQFKLQNILQRLLKEPILYTEFLELLTQATDSLYETPELEFELLLSNGLPLEFDGDFVYLKTTKTLFRTFLTKPNFLHMLRLSDLTSGTELNHQQIGFAAENERYLYLNYVFLD